MSAIDLVILGLAKKKSMSAYEIAQYIEHRGMREVVQVSTPSIYKNARELHEKRYLDMRVVQESEMPPKKVYSVNEKGHERFLQLMREQAASAFRIEFPFNSFVAFLHMIEADEGLALIEMLRRRLDDARIQVEHIREIDSAGEIDPPLPCTARSILDQKLRVIDTLEDWISTLPETLASEDAT